MIIIRFISLPLSWVYGFILVLRNKLFDWGILSVVKVKAKVISVGNLSFGGTGKTPHVEFLVKQLSNNSKTAILLRGYGRTSTGYQKVTSASTVEQVGDEALTYIREFGDKIIIAVCEKRVEGAQRILQEYPETETIILDDAFQHRYIYRDVNILLTECARPWNKDFVVPAGRLREFRSGKKRADIVVVTKSPAEIDEQQKETVRTQLKVKQNTPVHFSSIVYEDFIDLQTGEKKQGTKNILLVTGIGNPTPLMEHLQKQANVKLIQFNDHHQFTPQDITKIHKIFDTFALADKSIVTTRKDRERLRSNALNNEIRNFPWLYQSITVKIENENELLNEISQYANKN